MHIYWGSNPHFELLKKFKGGLSKSLAFLTLFGGRKINIHTLYIYTWLSTDWDISIMTRTPFLAARSLECLDHDAIDAFFNDPRYLSRLTSYEPVACRLTSWLHDKQLTISAASNPNWRDIRGIWVWLSTAPGTSIIPTSPAIGSKTPLIWCSSDCRQVLWNFWKSITLLFRGFCVMKAKILKWQIVILLLVIWICSLRLFPSYDHHQNKFSSVKFFHNINLFRKALHY